MSKDYNVAVYIRLSLADEDTGYSKDESDSIGNQRMLINRFLDNHAELSGCRRVEFADDGYTGTNFRRPQFTKMMEQVRAGEIDLICVKDFSRFSRDYIETGNYLECVFPFLGVRFISINDGYDSNDYKGTTGGLEVVMRNIIYAAYSKDLSVKTTTAKIQMMKQGKYVGGYAPYGYILHPEIRNKLKLDPEAAAIVRRVFDEALDGNNTSVIAEALNDDGIPTPGQYFRARHPEKKKYSAMSDKISWTSSMVYKIIVNYVYTGATVGHTMKTAAPLSRKRVIQDKKDWIIVEGMHEAIVSKEEYEAAQKVIRGGVKKATREKHLYPLRGLVCCGNCKRTMTRRLMASTGKYIYSCTHSTRDRNTECAVHERYEEAGLEQVAYNAIQQFISLAEKENVQNRKVSALRKDAISDCMTQLRKLQTQAEQLKGSKLRWYEKYTNGDISKPEYLKFKADADKKLAENEEAQREAESRMERLDSERTCSDDRLDAACRDFQKSRQITYELAHAFIKAVYVYPDERVEIEWKFKDSFVK